MNRSGGRSRWAVLSATNQACRRRRFITPPSASGRCSPLRSPVSWRPARHHAMADDIRAVGGNFFGVESAALSRSIKPYDRADAASDDRSNGHAT
uniref:Uncharacterized protein n=1 Tax=Plectus sambesii TaxID=2011161 RepID=A0A914W0N0_9BILA